MSFDHKVSILILIVPKKQRRKSEKLIKTDRRIIPKAAKFQKVWYKTVKGVAVTSSCHCATTNKKKKLKKCKTMKKDNCRITQKLHAHPQP